MKGKIMGVLFVIYLVCVIYLLIQMDNYERDDHKGLEEMREAIGLAFLTMLIIAIIYAIIYA